MKKLVYPRRVREVMVVEPVVVRPETGLSELLALFEKYDFNGFPVVEGKDTLVGMVTKLDLLRVFRSPHKVTRPDSRAGVAERVIDVMTRGVITVAPDDALGEAIDLMVDYRLRSLPVAEKRPYERRLVGMLSRMDVLRFVSLDVPICCEV